MDTEDKEELKALVLGFLQQGLRDNPNGYTLQEFERSFPDKTDEPFDWYKRYQKRNTLEALECIQDVVRVGYDNRRGCTLISLNKQSDKVDTHLIDLITNQRSSSKKKRFPSRPSSRALTSFSLNRQFSSFHNRANSFKSRINHDQRYHGENFFKEESQPTTSAPFRPSIYNRSYNSPSPRMAANDPRNRMSSGSMIPPQVRPTSQIGQLPVSKPRETPYIVRPPPQAVTVPRSTFRPVVTGSTQPKQPAREENPVIQQKKNHLRQRIVTLLTNKLPEIKLLHLSSLYQLEYDEKIDTAELGHANLTTLLQDPMLAEYIQINSTSGFVTISIRDKVRTQGKENVRSERTNSLESNGTDSNCQTEDESTSMSAARTKLNAIDTFNVKNMLQSLEPIGLVKEPAIKNIEIDESVKFKTMRMVFKSQGGLKLDEWEVIFESETRFKIRIRDFGFRTVLEFFRKLEEELPLKLKRIDGEWVAVVDIQSMSSWVHDNMNRGSYRAITAIDVVYELIAFPDEVYTFAQNTEALHSLEYQPVFILSVKLPCSVWVQIRSPKRIEDHLYVEASMTCYEDYKNQNLLTVPGSFVKPGFPCAVFDNTQQRWCRALILKAPDKVDKNYDVSALLVDYATIRNYQVTQLLCLMKSHFKLPVGPIYSRLYGVEDENSLEVQKRVKITLHEYTSPPVTLACKFRRAVPPEDPTKNYLPRNCFEVTLVDTRYGRDCNLADMINIPQGNEDD